MNDQQPGDEVFRTAFEHASVGVCVLDTEGRVLRANQALCEMLGYTPGELAGRSFRDVTHPEDVSMSSDFLSRATGGVVARVGFDKRYVRKDGQIVWGHLSAAVASGAPGQKPLVIAYVQDITERKQADLERLRLVLDLSRAVESRRAIIDAMPEAISVFSRDGTLVEFKTSEDKPSLTDPRDFIGKKLSDPRLADLPAVRLLAKLEQAFATRETQYFDYEVVVDGVTRSRASTVRAISGDEAVWVTRDVTRYLQAAQQSAESEIKLRVAVNAARLGLFEWDIKRDRFEWDDATCQIFGVTRDTMPRDRAAFRMLVHPDDRERVKDLADVALHTGVYRAVEYRIVRPDGTIRWTATRGAVTFDPDGAPAKIVGGVLDITAERDLDAQRRLSQKLEAIGQLSAGMAHNFNNMMMGILPNLELALVDATPDAAELLESARDSALRAAELVRQFMMFTGRAGTAQKSVQDAGAFVQRALQICRRTFDKAIELVAVLPDHPEMVLADSAQVEQALLNVLINARDALTDAHVAAPRIRVVVDRVAADSVEHAHRDLAPRSEYVCVKIEDNGPGMTDTVRSRIFDPFFTTKDVGRGTGLGLSTTIAIVREHGGVIDCVSSPGAGATFCIYLPVAPAAQPEQTPSEHPAASLGSETILVVDDESAVRNVVKRILERAGYEVLLAAGGQEALDLLGYAENRERVALALIDMSMPSMSGTEVRRRLKELAPGLRVAYFTGYAPDDADDVDGVITKPIASAHLLSRVRELLDRAIR